MKSITNRLNKFTVISGLAIGAVVGLSAAPASAVTFTGGELDFGIFTTPFANQVKLVPGNTVDLTFNPSGTASILKPATGSFASVFTTPIVGVAPAPVSLSYVNGNSYKLNNNLVFAFANGVDFTLAQNSIFNAAITNSNSASLSLASNAGSFFTSGGDITNIPTFGLTVNDTGLPSRGLYVGSASPTAVPEPFTVIGTIIGGTAAFRIRKKLLASVEK